MVQRCFVGDERVGVQLGLFSVQNAGSSNHDVAAAFMERHFVFEHFM